MEYSKDILGYEEQVVLQLRTLYRKYGYTPYKMSRFEEYELYAANKAFLPSGEILTFSGVGGKLMALRPDVTLSIVKYTKDDSEMKKLYYNENVYRSDGVEFKEQMQVGLECIGKIDIGTMGEVIMLAKQSLKTLRKNSRLDISHMGYLGGLLQSRQMTIEQKSKLVNCISEKNISELKTLCTEFKLSSEFCKHIITLATLYGSYEEVEGELRRICINEEMNAALQELDELHSVLSKLGVKKGVNIDFSVVNDISYYSGVIFQGYIEGIPEKVLSGGRYDKLLHKFGKNTGAIGFAVYLDKLENTVLPKSVAKPGTEPMVEPGSELRTEPGAEPGTKPGINTETVEKMINIALPKGRLGEKAYSIFDAAGYRCPEILEESRKLVFESPENGVRYFWVKPSDVARYVERGAADIGIVGKDILLEYSPDVYELLDIGIGKCKMCVAAETDFIQDNGNLDSDSSGKTLRVATKFPNIARNHYAKQGREIDVVELSGSIELAPLLNLSDVIVDIVESGRTLLENEMEPIETIADISARLISNKSSYKFNNKEIEKLCKNLQKGITYYD